jgi:hypothetical protein
VKALTGIAVALVLLVAPSTGVAQIRLPVGEANGVRVVRERGAIVFVFTQRAKRLYKRIAGRLVRYDCTELPDENPLRADTGGDDAILTGSGGGSTMRAPRRGRKLATGDGTRGMDYCRVWLPARKRRGDRQRTGPRLIVSVPLTQAGAVFLDEQSKALRLVRVLVAASLVAEQRHLIGVPTYGVLRDLGFRKAGKRLVGLATPTDTPPVGAIGYYSDGHDHVVVAIRSRSGRRLFIEYAGDVVSTNVTEYIYVFSLRVTP